MQTDTSQIKQAADLRDFCQRVGIPLDSHGFTRCIFHNEKTPSLKIYEKSYHCFGCGAHGDIISFAQEVWSCDFKSALRDLCDMYGFSCGAYRRNSFSEQMRRKREAQKRSEFDRKYAELERQKFDAARQLDRIDEIMRSPPESPEQMTEEFAWALANKDLYTELYYSADAEITNLLKGGGAV